MRELRAAALVVALTLVAAGCGDAGPTPAGTDPVPSAAESPAALESAEPSSAPTASPSPVDVAALTVASLADASFTATVTLDGTTKIGKARTATSGTIDIEGRASHLVRIDKTGKTSARTETLTGNGTYYVKQKGVWTNAGASDNTELIAVLRAIPAMNDLGVEDKDGRQLRHLQAPAVPAVPRELAPPASGVTDLASTLDAWVTEDGTPVLMTLASSWSQEVDDRTVDATRTTNLAFSNVGGEVSVVVPTDIWKFFTSKRYRYRIAYPETFEAKAGTGRFADSFYGGEEYAYASRARQTRATLAFLTNGILGDLRSITGYKSIKVVSNKKSTLDGLPARRIEFRGRSSGETVYGQAVYAIKGAFWYFVGFDSYTRWNKQTRATFTTFVKTFDFR